MPASSPRHPPPPRSHRPSHHHNSTTHAAFTHTVRSTLDAPLPPPPHPSRSSSRYLPPSPDPSSSSSSSPNTSLSSPQFRNSAPLPRRGNALRRPTTPNGWHGDIYSAPLTPPSPSSGGGSGNDGSSGSTTPVDGDTLAATESVRSHPTTTTAAGRRRSRHDSYHPTAAFAHAAEEYGDIATNTTADDEEEEGFLPRWRPAPGKCVPAAIVKPRPSQRKPSAAATHDDGPEHHAHTTALPRHAEELYTDLGIIAALPSLEPRDHLASLEAMNDALALWAVANPVAGVHVAGMVSRWRVSARFEGTLRVDAAGEWVQRRRLSAGASFAQRMRRKGGVAEKGVREEAVRRGGRRWEDVPLALVLLYSEICGVDVARMSDREVKEMLADWAARYWPVSDENLLNVMMEWGGETKGKVDLDPRKWKGEDEGKVERVVEKIRGLGREEVRRGDSLMERLLVGRERRRDSVRAAKR